MAKKRKELRDEDNLNKTQSVLYQREFKRADRASGKQ
ncbi:hypothetical protein JOD43_000870 [Pullulanibacillus pueri]|nr:YfhE family protein [Pullulanibacillus pueri]MBM7680706.1 hypothetical protein [Pullulanibacillus pueri]